MGRGVGRGVGRGALKITYMTLRTRETAKLTRHVFNMDKGRTRAEGSTCATAEHGVPKEGKRRTVGGRGGVTVVKCARACTNIILTRHPYNVRNKHAGFPLHQATSHKDNTKALSPATPGREDERAGGEGAHELISVTTNHLTKARTPCSVTMP